MRNLAVLLGVLLLAIPAHAQSDDVFTPTSGWLVGPASAAPSDGGSSLPCVMMNQYDNGYTLRLSGGGKKLLAMAIDFRQAAFRAGVHYPVTVTVGKEFVKKLEGNAYTNAILIVSAPDPQTAKDFYAAVAKGKQLDLAVGKQVLNFSLIAAPDGLSRLESCYGGADSVQVDANGEATAPEINTHPGFNAPADAGGVDKLLAQAAQNVAETANGPTPMPASTPAASAAQEPHTQWRAKAQGSLKDLLGQWSKQSGVHFVWAAPDDWKVRETLSVEGSYEQAVQGVLTEYAALPKRPVGNLIVDPKTGEKTLEVRTLNP